MTSTNYGIIKYGKPAEKAFNLCFLEKFRSNEDVQKNSGTINGSPTFNNNVTLDGTNDYISYNEVHLGTSYTIIIKNLNLNAFNTTVLGGSVVNEYLFYIDSSKIYHRPSTSFASVNIAHTANTNENNTFAIVRNGTNVDFYQNGVQLGTTQTLASNVTGQFTTIGAEEGGTSKTNGSISNIKIFSRNLSPEDILEYHNETMWKYKNNCLSYYNLNLESYDPTRNQILDALENTNVNLGDGTTSATFPTKLTHRKGYSFDGVNDYFGLPAIGANYPYMLLDNFEFSESTTDYGNIAASGSYEGNVYYIAVYDTELTDIQKIDLKNKMIQGVNRK